MKVISQKTQTKKKATIPKIVCGIIATISIVVIGVFSLSPFWFWTSLEIVAGLLVAGGCWGEWYLFKNPADEGDESAKHLHHSREVRCIIAVAIGVTVEFVALAHSIPEAVQLEKDVAQIGSTNAQLVADNLMLRSNVVALELKMQPRIITQKQINDFIFLMQHVKKIPVKISIGQEGFDTETYGRQIRDMFTKAKFANSIDSGTWGIFRDSSRLEARNFGKTKAWPFVEIVYYSTNNDDYFETNNTFTYNLTASKFSNSPIPLPVVTENDPVEYVFYAIDYGFKQIGIPTEWRPSNQWVKPGEFEIFIPLKNQ